MRVRTYLGFLLGLLVLAAVAILVQLNEELLRTPFQITPDVSVPFYALLLGVFLTAFLPTATLLLIQSVRRDLELRSARRAARKTESLDRGLHRGMDFLTDGQAQRALDELGPVLEARPRDFLVLLHYGIALRQQGRAQEALDMHQKGAVLFPQSVTLLHQIALDYEALDQPEVAMEIRNRIVREFPGTSVRVLRRRRDSALEAGNWSEASELHERILGMDGAVEPGHEEDPISLGLRYQAGVRLLEEDRPAEAQEVFLSVLDEAPLFLPARIMLGEAAQLQEMEGAAVETWLEGYQQTGNPIFLQRLEDHFIESADAPRAIETLWGLIGRVDNDLLPRFFLGRLYYRLEMQPEALKVLDSIAERVGSSPTYHFLRARILQKMGRLDAAIGEYQSSIQQAGIPQTEYVCSVCHAPQAEWSAQCRECRSWSSIQLDFQEEHIDPEALGVRPAPVWGEPIRAGAADHLEEDSDGADG